MRERKNGRSLTSGEIAMASLIFQDAIDYGAVRIYDRPYLWLGLQPKNVAMAPNGRIYFHRSRHLDDFSTASVAMRRWFIHEMVHVWQYQRGYPVKLRGALRIGLHYAYGLSPGRRLSDYNMEAQGELLADYFALKYLEQGQILSQPQYGDDIALYEVVLADFLADRATPVICRHGASFGVFDYF
jgi:hypothetical protein